MVLAVLGLDRQCAGIVTDVNLSAPEFLVVMMLDSFVTMLNEVDNRYTQDEIKELIEPHCYNRQEGVVGIIVDNVFVVIVQMTRFQRR